MAVLIFVAAVSWAGCSALAACALSCVRQAKHAVRAAQSAAGQAEAASIIAKNAAERASGFRRTRQGLR